MGVRKYIQAYIHSYYTREEDFDGPPWPLTLDEVALFNRAGLTELSHAIHTEESKISNTRFRVLYTKIA